MLCCEHLQVLLEGNDCLVRLVRLDVVAVVKLVMVDVMNVGLVDRMQKDLLDRETPLQRHQAYLGSYSHDLVLEGHLLECAAFVHLVYLVLVSMRYPVLARALLELLEFFGNQGVQQRPGTVLGAVEGTEREDEELDQDLHLVLILDDEVDVSSSELQRYAIPRMEWQVLELLLAH